VRRCIINGLKELVWPNRAKPGQKAAPVAPSGTQETEPIMPKEASAESKNHHRSPNGRRVEASLFCASSRLIIDPESHKRQCTNTSEGSAELCTTHNMPRLLAVASVANTGTALDRFVK
jgi:hypothetical protein